MKYLLLAKSNIRKTKGLTVGLLLLISLAACFLNVFLLIQLDFNKNAQNVADSLNTEDAYVLVSGDLNNLNENYINSISKGDTKEIEITKELAFVSDFPFNDGTITTYAVIGNEELFHNRIGKLEILEEDQSVKSNYIYLPYQFYTGGGYNLKDHFKFTILGTEYDFVIKGFVNTITLGSNNVGAYQLILSNDVYDNVVNDSAGNLDSLLVKFKLKDDVSASKFANKIRNKILIDYPDNNVISNTLDDAIFGRTFLGIIFGAILLIVCAIVLIIVVLMLSNNISNFIRENIKILGALKAIGYTNKDIKIAFLAEFIIIDIIGSAIGIVSSVFVMQTLGNIMMLQSAIPYTAHFKFITILITQVSLIAIILVSLLSCLRKTKKIEPIVALREGLDANSSKKNFLPFEKSGLPLTLNLSLKTMYQNRKQNIVTFVIVFALILMSSLSLVLYQNIALNPMYSIMTFEICDGVVNTDSDEDKEIYNYLNNYNGVQNVRLIAENNINVGEAKLLTYIIDDISRFKNQEVLYEGNFPKNENEIVVSGKFAKLYGYSIGDKIEVKNGSKVATYKLTGLMQTLNNNGQESIMLESGSYRLFGTDYEKSYYFEIKDGVRLDSVFEGVNNQFGNKVRSTIDFEKTAEGVLSTFNTIASALVILVFVINALIILLVLYMLIKTLINKKKKEYGILKALGYTSRQIIFQNALSFIPAILISVVLASILSYFTMNNIIGIVLNLFGIMKLTFEIPVLLLVLMGILFVVISLLFALLLSRKIKKIEPYKLLIAD